MLFARISQRSAQKCYQSDRIRWFAASKTTIINVRTMQKQLFGQPIGGKKTKRFVPKIDPLPGEVTSSTSSEAEIYWMCSRSKNVKTFTKNSSKDEKNKPNDDTTNAKLSTKSDAPHRLPIPFDDDELRTMTTFPMNCAKADISLVNGLLDDKSNRLPSVSRILQATMSEGARTALKRWKLKKIDELGFDGFQLYQQEILSTGKQFHEALDRYLANGEVPDSTSPVIKLWHSLSGHLTELNPKAILIEKPIIHPHLKYQGIIDNVSLIK